MSQASSAGPSVYVGQEPHVNVAFPVLGSNLPADHGYLIYSAISRALPALHKVHWLAIELVSGFPSGPGLVTLTATNTLNSQTNSKLGTRNSKLSLRIPAGHYRDVLALAGKPLDIAGHQIRLGLPIARSLGPYALAGDCRVRIPMMPEGVEHKQFRTSTPTFAFR